MTEHTDGRGRRLWVSAAAAVLAAVGAGLLTVGLLSQEPAPPSVPQGKASGGSGEPTRAAQPPSSPSNEPGEYKQPTGPVMDSSRPTRVRIPALDVSTGIIRLGLQGDGTMEVPQGPGTAGWYDKGPTPGALGPSVIAAHVTWNQEPDVFFELATVKVGQKVKVDRKDGSTSVFEVTEVKQYKKKNFPTERVYGSIDHAGIRLVTCGGVFDGDEYSDNVVVYGKLVRAIDA
jgi:LPXTG-site transpeptidase (sortase) family protein